MRSSFALLALAAGVLARPQGVTSAVAPSATAPAGCSSDYAGKFEITVVNVTSSKRRSLAERQAAGILTLSLAGGILTDQAGRTGYIASNYQFQFDAPPQDGAIFTSGFSVCGNKSLALGGSSIFYQCDSGGFFNLYDRSWAAQCSPIYLVAQGGSPATQLSDGQPAATTVVPSVAVTQLTDGQPGGTAVLSSVIVSLISDGQPQGIPVTQISDGQPQGPTGVPVTQISDGQIQAPTSTPAPVSIASDGQIVATSAATSAVGVVSIASDGQIVASSLTTSAAVPVSQLSDGQPQFISTISITSAVVVSQATDGQIVASTAPATSAVGVVSIKSDGQPVAAPSTLGTATSSATANGTVSTAAPAQFTGGVAENAAGKAWVVLLGAAAAVLAM